MIPQKTKNLKLLKKKEKQKLHQIMILTENVTSLESFSCRPILNTKGPTFPITNNVFGCKTHVRMKYQHT